MSTLPLPVACQDKSSPYNLAGDGVTTPLTVLEPGDVQKSLHGGLGGGKPKLALILLSPHKSPWQVLIWASPSPPSSLILSC